MSNEKQPKEEKLSREEAKALDVLCKRRDVTLTMTVGYDDGQYVFEWETRGPKGFNNASGGYTNAGDCAEAARQWLEQQDSVEDV